MCTALYMMVLYDRARVGPTTKTLGEISIICLFRLILQANPLFVLSCGIRVASMSNVGSIPSLSGVLILLCEYQYFMIIGLSCQSFSTDMFLFKWIRSFQHPQDHLSVFPNVVCFICSKLPLFSRPPTLFLQGLRFLNHVSFYLWEVSSFFYFNVLIR